jgi:hypothetical protein
MSGNNHTVVQEGDTYTLTVTFRTRAGALATPTTTTYAQRTPAQTETTGTAVTTGWTTASTGVQTRDIVFNTPGLWCIEARGAGNSVDDVQQFYFDVQRSVVRV